MTIQIDHIGFAVSDYAAAKKFYADALKPLRIFLLMEFGDAAGLGADGKPFLWISGGGKTQPHAHVAFRAETREQVDAFHAAAMAAGATDNGPPGLRPHYHQNYYGAFILDPDGHNLEAVCHASAEELAAANKPVRKSPSKRSASRGKPATKPARRIAGKPARKAVAKPARKTAKAAAKRAPAKKPAARKPAARGKKKTR